MKVGPDDEGVPTGTEETRTVCTVPAISVLATLAAHEPVRVVLEGLGAKHEMPLLSSTEEAKAPDERSCSMCSPADAPVNPDSLI